MQPSTPPQDLRILMLEDTPSDAQLMEYELHKEGISFVVKRVTTSGAFSQALEEFHPDIVLSDYNLPAFTGLDALRLVRQNHPHLPVIMVTGALPDIEAVELIHAGANDYVLKDRLARLPSAIERALTEAQDARNRRLAEGKFRALFTEARDGIVLVDCATGAILECNPAFEQMNGRRFAQLEHMNIWELSVPAHKEATRAHFQNIHDNGSVSSLELEFVKPDGVVFFVDISAKVIRIQDVCFTQVVCRDITQRKQAEELLRRANRALKTLSAGNMALVHATSEEELLKTVTRVIVEEGGYRLAVVDYPEEDPGKSLTPMAWSGMEEGAYWAQGLTWGETDRPPLPVATAIRNGSTQISSDIDHDPAFEPWHEAAQARGYLSNIALPLSTEGKIFGALSIYADRTHAFEQREEVQLLEELANDLAYGITTLRARVAHEERSVFLQHSLEQTIQVIAATVEARDPYTAGHQRRVADLATAIAHEMELSPDRINGIHLAASFHDLGKIHIPAEILSKPGKLTVLEFDLIKQHPQAGYDIMKNVTFPWPIAQIILQHHERLDGSGYPQGLEGGHILLEARIVAVADVVEAMSSHRPYRPGLGIEAALEEIQQHRGSLFEPAAVDACITLFGQRGYTLPS